MAVLRASLLMWCRETAAARVDRRGVPLASLAVMPVRSAAIPPDLSCPYCDSGNLREWGELLIAQPPQQLRVTCLECGRVFSCTPMLLVEHPLAH